MKLFGLIFVFLIMVCVSSLAQIAAGSSCSMSGLASGGSGALLYCNGSNLYTVGETLTATGTSGLVGINSGSPVATLDVGTTGGIRIGNDTASCSSANAGETKYASNLLYVCNGTNWSTIGVASAVTGGCGQSNTYSTGGTQATITVSTGCTVIFKAWGGGGGGGTGSVSADGGPGGGGRLCYDHSGTAWK